MVALLSAAVLLVAGVLDPGAEAVSFFGVDVPVLCWFRRATGYSCPGCGMTRSFVFFAHGQPWQAFQMNYLSPAVFLLVAGQIPYRAIRMYKGPPPRRTRRRRRMETT